MPKELICVKAFTNRQEAELAKGALQASGIEAMLAADDMGGEIPGLDFPQGVGVLVREEDLEAAEEVLQIRN